jgi:phosphoglycerate dehydrogenase-like enzyme
MSSVIVVHPDFDLVWPWAADHFRALWEAEAHEAGSLPPRFVRLDHGDDRPLGLSVPDPDGVTRLVALSVPVTSGCLGAFPSLREAVVGAPLPEGAADALAARGVRLIRHGSEGYWGQSVSEFALGLTIGALRRIPQTHHDILTSQEPWQYNPADGVSGPGKRGQQFGDDPQFVNGTVEGKRVRIVGAGNIASRYASFCRMLGADVAAWDPFASEPCFHRAGSRRERHLDRLVEDADIFAHIGSLPKGALAVIVTRAHVVDTEALRRRVLADELALAADVFDVEPLSLDDPLLGRSNVVHTPHNAGRTIDANRRWAEMLAEQFDPASRVG